MVWALLAALSYFTIQGFLLGVHCFQHNQWIVAIYVSCLFLSWQIYKKYGWLHALVFAGAIGVTPITAFHNVPQCQFLSNNLLLNDYAMAPLLFLIPQVAGAMYLNRALALHAFAILSVLDSIGMFCTPHIGIMIRPGIDGIFIAMTMPLILDLPISSKIKFALFPACLAAIFISDSTTAIILGVLFSIYLAFLLAKQEWQKYVIALVILFSTICYTLSFPYMWSFGDREKFWLHIWNYWSTQGWLKILAPFDGSLWYRSYWYIQSKNNFLLNQQWIFPHNESIQIAFSYGLIGLAACLVLAGINVWRLRVKHPELIAFMFFIIASCIHYPLREFPTSLLFLVLLRRKR